MARREEEKEQFVVSDKRKFTSEGELRPDVQQTEEAPPQPTFTPVATAEPTPPASANATNEGVGSPTDEVTDEKMPPPPSAAEQKAQHDEYYQAGKKIDSMLDAAGAQRPPDAEMNFERLIASLYMQAMMQLGMLREENVAPQPDLIGARQTIDTIALLNDKTKGNLTDRETHMLQNCLFELRMAFLEITNMITRPPDPAGKPASASGGIKR